MVGSGIGGNVKCMQDFRRETGGEETRRTWQGNSETK
jgi:hypothetical protein